MGKANSELFREAMTFSKRELARKFISATQQLSTWTELGLSMAAYYYNIEPHAAIFTDNTFNPSTLQIIKERALLALRDIPYKRVVYIVNESGEILLQGLKVDVVSLTNDTHWRKLIENLNRDREEFLKEGIKEKESADCNGCIFKESCGESTTKTGLRVYDCMQYSPINKGEKDE